ncbi:MAG TPA: hypothetical protein DEA52_01390 [Clostridiaceae bacterium]|nr:hypothetical protein [Clostridiaceae bacterium]
MKVEICVGSSCHVKGSYEVVKNLEAFLEEEGLTKEVSLGGCFCMGHCTQGVSLRIGEKVYAVSEDTVTALVKKQWKEEEAHATDEF